MLVFSLIFYAWGEPVYVLLLLFMTLVCWLSALGIEKCRKNNKNPRVHLVIACVVSLLLIGIFKYSSFVLGNFSSLTGIAAPEVKISLPIGISFYTFQLMTYVVDVYRGDAPAQRRYHNLPQGTRARLMLVTPGISHIELESRTYKTHPG